MDAFIRQAHPGPGARPYDTAEEKMRDAEKYKQEDDIPWPVVVDDLEGTVHQVYGGLADPTYLIDADGQVAYFCMWTHAPTLYLAIEALLGQGGRGVVRGGVDHTPHFLPSMIDGWKGIRHGLPQSFTDMAKAAPGMSTGTWLGYQLRPLLAPIGLRARPLPGPVQATLAAGATVLAGLALRRLL